jgi:uncharacterized repeat protein (TIGR01451 family)
VDIGTIPGRGAEGSTFEGTWRLHCKEACESTINITPAEGLDEYGWHKKQACANTGNFIIEGGCMVIEGLESFDDNLGWAYGVLVGDASGLLGPFSIDTPMNWAMTGGGPDVMAHLVAQGYVIPHVGPGVEHLIEEICGMGGDSPNGCHNINDNLGFGIEGSDIVVFVGKWEAEAPVGPFWEAQCVIGGLVEIINGKITGADVQFSEGMGLQVVSFLGGTYCSSMATEPGRPIDPRWIEDSWVTVKQLPSEAVDIGLVKKVDDATPEVGQDVMYAIMLTNYGPGEATGVEVTDTIDDTVVNFVSASATQGTYDDSTGVWTVGNMAVGAKATLLITAEVQSLDEYANDAWVTADQADGNPRNDADTAVINSSLAIELEDGWNFVSWPLIPDNANIEPEGTGVLSDLVPLTDSVDVVWGEFDPVVGSASWQSYDPDSLLNDLAEMRDGEGYWIDMAIPGQSILIEGREQPLPPATPRVYPMVGGAGGYWNAVGFKSTTPLSPDDYFAGIAGQYTIIYGFDDGAYFVVGTPGNEMLEPGLAYWVAVLTSGNIFP